MKAFLASPSVLFMCIADAIQCLLTMDYLVLPLFFLYYLSLNTHCFKLSYEKVEVSKVAKAIGHIKSYWNESEK